MSTNFSQNSTNVPRARLLAEREALIRKWESHTNEAIINLIQWGQFLQRCRNAPVDISDHLFMRKLDKLAQAGLLEWADAAAPGLDDLRATLTGEAA